MALGTGAGKTFSGNFFFLIRTFENILARRSQYVVVDIHAFVADSEETTPAIFVWEPRA